MGLMLKKDQNYLVIWNYNEIQRILYQTEERINNLNNYKKKKIWKIMRFSYAIKSDSKYLGFNKLAELALEHELQ